MPIRTFLSRWILMPQKGLQSGQIQFLYAPTHLNPTYEYGVTFERGTAVIPMATGNKSSFPEPRVSTIKARSCIRGYPETDGTHAGKHRHLAAGGGKRIARHHAGNRLLARPGRLCRGQAIYRKPVSVVSPPDRHAPVCRPGWLIETECIAVIPADAPQYAYL